MTAKYTPAPWKTERDITTRKTHCWRIHSSDVRDLAGLEFAHKQDCDGYGAANARLIAAAPALADALREIAGSYPRDDEAAGLADIARAALRHLEG
jgi:hypothetical protein